MAQISWLFIATILAADTSPSEPVKIERAEQFEMKSSTGSTFRIYLYRPAAPAPSEGYSALYFTDGNNAFPLAVSLAKMIERVSGPVALVGIGYPVDDPAEISRRRTYDLTPLTPVENILKFQAARIAAGGKMQGKGLPSPPPSEIKTGGNEQLFTFIQNDVKPEIARRISVNPLRHAFFGHSYGGLFSLHCCLVHPEAFQSYIIASPSLWLNQERLAALERDAGKLLVAASSKPRVLITLGEEERQALGNQILDQREQSAASQLCDRMKTLGFDANYREFPGENHGSVIPFALMSGIRHAFQPPIRN